jgi:hypothetical protein
MDDFTGSLTATPKRAMDRNLMGNDAATLRALCGTLNNPNITGAVVPPEEKITQITAPMPTPMLMTRPASSPLAAAVRQQLTQAAQVLEASAPVSAATEPLTPHQKREERAAAQKQSFVIAKALDKAIEANKAEAKPQPATSHQPTKRLFFTGHPGSGKQWLAAQIKARIFGFADPIFSLATSAFGQIEDHSILTGFVREVTAWGEGIVTPDFPFTAARAMFCDKVHDAGTEGDKLMGISVAGFGTPGFWTASLLARVDQYAKDNPPATVAVTDIQTPEQYKTLRNAGFRAYHVACHSTTLSKRGAATNAFSRVAAMIEQDITNKLSREPQGAKLWCVWNDTENAAPSPRFLSLSEFLSAYQ